MWNSTLGLGLWVAYLPMSHPFPKFKFCQDSSFSHATLAKISPSNSSKAQLFVGKAFQS